MPTITPKRLLILVASTLAMLAASMIFAQLLEGNEPLPPSPDDAANRYLNLPVLAKMADEATEPVAT